MNRFFLLVVAFALSCLSSTQGLGVLAAPQKSSGYLIAKSDLGNEDRGFIELADKYLEFMMREYPTAATSFGVHKYDSRLPDYCLKAQVSKSKQLKKYLSEFQSINFEKLSRDNKIDWNLVVADIKSKMLEIDSIQYWKRNPDFYSSEANNSIYTLVQRDFAPLDERLKSVIAREKQIPAFIAKGRKNLVVKKVPKIYAEISLEQMPGIISFFKETLPETFKSVKDKNLLSEFTATNQSCIAALVDYKTYIKEKVLPDSKGKFAIGEKNYLEKLYAEELVDSTIDDLLKVGEAELDRLKKQFVECAKSIDKKQSPNKVYEAVASKHPEPDKLITSTSSVLEEIRSFCIDKNICTIPGEERARVAATPPFMRALVFAAMDTPGPFEKNAKEAYYYVTPPEKSWDKKRIEEHLRSFSNQDLLNTSVHEAYPGHYTQFLWVNKAPTKIRKVFGCSSNAEGWAHYCEQMMVEEGFKNNSPELRLCQIHDALLRVCRYIAGVKMHTRGMTMKEAIKLFEEDGFQEHANAVREVKRGTMDPTYLVYTLGKLKIIAMKEDFRKSRKKDYQLKDFHNRFLKQGYPPLSLVRAEMLKEPVKKHF